MALTKAEVLKIVKQKKVKFVKLWFVDIQGQLKNFSISIKTPKKCHIHEFSSHS